MKRDENDAIGDAVVIADFKLATREITIPSDPA